MATLTITVPNGPIATKLGQAALAWWDVRHANDQPPSVRPNALGAMQEMVITYLRDVYRQAQINDAAQAAQAAITAAGVQAATDGAAIT